MNKQKILHDHFSELGKKGSKSRWNNTTAEERREIALKMVKAREDKKLSTESLDVTDMLS